MSDAWAYRSLLRLLLPVILAYTLGVALRNTCARYLMQRCGCYHERDTTRPLWIHCASVGETRAAMPLIKAWHKHHPNDTFVLTTNTISAAHTLASNTPHTLSQHIRHHYLPLDYPLFCRRFLDAIKPCAALIIETEIWLNLFSACRRRNIPLLIVNARLSERTLKGARYFGRYYRLSLAAVTRVLARHSHDAEAFVAIGAQRDQIEIIGNLKRAMQVTANRLPNLLGRRYFLAASTHDNEELQVAKAWRCALEATDCDESPLLVIAPRHPQRGAAIERQLTRRHFPVQRRSRAPQPHGDTVVYIADTLGELPALIRHAELVFMGGSLVPVGGHNVLEAAQLGTPQVVGPYTHNFNEEVAALQAADGLLKVADFRALIRIFSAALSTPDSYRDTAHRARAWVQAHAHIADTYVTHIKRTIDGYPP